ncbi:MAG: hypothetical protein Fur0035_04880 [Anaerolineales bacterium]
MSETRGIVLLCDQDGNILHLIQDSLGLGDFISLGAPFPRLALRGGLDKALSFLVELKSNGAAYGWEINLMLGGAPRTLYFAGGRHGDELLIVGAESGRFALSLYEEMARINNEQANLLRAALKEQSRGAAFFDEISRLNNELVTAQRELARKNAQLARLNEEKNRFLGMAAHDLRNPLYAILSSSELMLENSAALSAEQHQHFLAVIHNSSRFMAGLVDDLLDVAKIESGQLQLNLEMVDVTALARDNLAWNQSLAARKQISIEAQLEALPPALLDAAKMEQVLNNLIGNAIKFSSPGAIIQVSLSAAGENFLLRVEDHGIGISEEQKARLFQPFQRGQSGTGGEKSIGLGLAIVRRIVEGHKGKIWFESQPGVGTTFFVCLPFSAAIGDVKR